MNAEQTIIEKDDDFMFRPVDAGSRRSTFRQTMVWVGFGYVVTGLFVGGALAGTEDAGMSLSNMLLAVVIGQGTLVLFATILGIISQKTGMGLALLSKFSYGKKGFVLPLIIMGILTLGWFSLITGMVGTIWGDFLGNNSGIVVFDSTKIGLTTQPIVITLEVFVTCLLFGIIVTLTSIWGIKGLEAIAVPVSPIIVSIAVIIGVTLLHKIGGVGVLFSDTASRQGLTVSSAVTMVIGSWIAGVIMGTELFRFNKTKFAVFLGAASCFIITNPLLNIVGYLGAVTVGQFNYMSWLITISVILGVVGVISWTLSLWTTNDAELYCNSMYTGPAIHQILGVSVNKKILIGVVGILGTLIGSFGFYQLFFSDFINLLGVMSPPIIGPILVDFYIVRKQKYEFEKINKLHNFSVPGFISFFVGALLGLYLYILDIKIAFPIALITLFTTMIVYFIWILITKKSVYA